MAQSRGALLLLYASFLLFLAGGNVADNDLQLEHLSVVFRHGDRVPELYPQRFPNDPYMSNRSAFPMGSGGLTKEGKARMYGLGELLRERYDNYLGKYEERRLFAVSSDMGRTKMSLQLVLAALYKPSLHPKSKWHSQLDWQPIPTTYYHFKDDKFFNQDMCTIYLEEFDKIYKSDEVQNELKSYESYLENLRQLIGKKSRVTLNDINLLHNNLDLERRLNLTMQPWMINLLEEGTLRKLRVYSYKIRGQNEVLRRMAVGYLLRYITEDIQQARNKTAGHERKISLFSGHDKTLINLLQAFNLYDSQLPEFSSALLFELFSNNGQNYFVKLYYYLGIPEVIETLTIPGCATLCPLDDFLRLTKNVVATDEEKNCKILADSYFSPID